MNTKQYLDRIKYSGELAPTLDTLKRLQAAHLLNVPFENLDIHSKIKIELSKSFEKIIGRNRGGFCYELNGLFFQLLKAIGFSVKMVSARVFNPEKKKYGQEFDHMAIIADINNKKYLSDVGFGEFALYPLELIKNAEQHDPRGVFIFETFDEQYDVVKKKNDAVEFIPEYLFSAQERALEEFYGMCHYHQTSSESHFTQNRICSLATEKGRVTLTGSTLKITENGIVTEKQLSSEEEITKTLWNYFKVKL